MAPLAASKLENLGRAAHNREGSRETIRLGVSATPGPLVIKLQISGEVEAGATLKGLRHTVATILAESGSVERTFADMLGQQTIEMARHYSRRANKSRKLAGVMSEFDAEVSRRREDVVKP